MRRLALACFVICFTMPALAATQDLIRAYVPGAEKVGQGRLSVLFWDVYDVALYAPGGAWQEQKPYALDIAYRMELTGQEITDRTIEAMQQQGEQDAAKLARWREAMVRLFPDVAPGTILTGIRSDEGHTLIYRNGARAGKIEDPAFTERFFAIWLAENSPEPELRRQLLGLNP